MPQADWLIFNGHVLTMDNAGTRYPSGAVAIKDGRIIGIGREMDFSSWSVEKTLDAQGGVIMPGLVNTHTHLPMSLFRGLADDLPLEQWLQEHIFPAEAKYVTPESVATGTRLSLAEMILGGITTICDGYFLAAHIAEVVKTVGMRAFVGQGVIDFPAPGVPDPKQNIDFAKRFVQKWQNRSNLIYPSIFCHAPYTCSAETLAAKKAADEVGALFQIHVAETQVEVQQCQKNYGCSPIQYLDRLHLLNSKTLLIHAVWVDQNDIQIIARSNARVGHCPESNMKLASGIAPIPEMLAAGIRVGLGTDGCASNNDLDLWSEMDFAAKLHKMQHSDPTVMASTTLLRMATIEGARALGLDQSVGSLSVGKEADLIVLDLRQPHLMPLYHLHSHLVYAAHAADVQHVMIGGKWVLQNRSLQTIDLAPLLTEAEKIGRAIGSKY